MKKIELFEVFEAASIAAKAKIEADRVANLYTEQNCPYKKGDKIKTKQGNFMVLFVSFSHASSIPGKASICVRPYTKDWEVKKDRFGKPRSCIFITNKEDII